MLLLYHYFVRQENPITVATERRLKGMIHFSDRPSPYDSSMTSLASGPLDQRVLLKQALVRWSVSQIQNWSVFRISML